MRRWTKRAMAMCLAMIMALSCCISATAAGEDPNRVYDVSAEEGYTLTLWDAADHQITTTTSEEADGETRDVYKGVAKLKLSFTGTVGEQYVVFLLNGGNKVPTQSNIRYINQQTGIAAMEFTIYPDDLTAPGEYTLHLSDSDSYTQVASLMVAEPLYTLGDVDESDAVNVGDVTRLLRYLANLTTEDEIVNLRAADVDGSGEVNVGDATKLLRVLANLDTL